MRSTCWRWWGIHVALVDATISGVSFQPSLHDLIELKYMRFIRMPS